MKDQIIIYFEEFGLVNSVEIERESNADTHFALVEFKQVQTAGKILASNRMYRIADCNALVKAADPWLQPDHILNALNDDCLRAILLQLNLLDLTSAANVCIRFNEQAKSVFSTKFKKKLNLNECSHQEAINSLQTFGALAQSIDVKSKTSNLSKSRHENEILTAIAVCCTDAEEAALNNAEVSSNLKELILREFHFIIELPLYIKFDKALSKLERLSLDACYVRDNLNPVLSACAEMRAIHMQSCFLRCDSYFWPKLHKLDELQLIDVASLDYRSINGIVAMNPKLKKFSLVHRYMNWKKTLPSIVGKLRNLLEMELKVQVLVNDDFAEGIRCLGRLRSLKVLKIKLGSQSAAPLYDVITRNALPIEHMQLIDGKIDTGIINAMAEMKHLKVLELDNIGGLTDEHMIELANGLGSRLEKLLLNGDTAEELTTIGLKKMLKSATKLSLLTLESTKITIDAHDYKTILGTLQKRQENVKLVIEITGVRGQIDVSDSIQMENRHIFYIHQKFDIELIVIDDDSDSDDLGAILISSADES